VEFAVEDGIPYAIDFMNPAPDADLHSVGAENFEWIVQSMAELAVKKAKKGPSIGDFHWGAYLSSASPKAVKKAVPKKAAPPKAKKKAEGEAPPVE
jgi:uncharacterized protein (UPF0264 family)